MIRFFVRNSKQTPRLTPLMREMIDCSKTVSIFQFMNFLTHVTVLRVVGMQLAIIILTRHSTGLETRTLVRKPVFNLKKFRHKPDETSTERNFAINLKMHWLIETSP